MPQSDPPDLRPPATRFGLQGGGSAVGARLRMRFQAAAGESGKFLETPFSPDYTDVMRALTNAPVPQIVAHRGYAREAPENSLAAFAHALELGVDGVEFDVQLTRDDVAVVYHDSTLERAGCPGVRIGDLNWDEIRHLRFATVPHVTPPGPIFSLDDVLNGFGHRTKLWVELKSRAEDRTNGRADRLADVCMREFMARDLVDRIHLLAFDLGLLFSMYERDRRLCCCWNMEDGIDLMTASDSTLRFLSGVGVRVAMLTPDVAEKARRLELDLYAFVVNTAPELLLAMKRHVMAVISDTPWEVAQHLKEFLSARESGNAT